MDNDEEKAKAIIREARARALGGFRALDTFTVETYREDEFNAPALAAAKAFSKTKANLYLCGPTGIGKSHLAAVAARSFLTEKGGGVITTTQMKIARAVRGAERAAKEDEVLERFFLSSVLVIDDLGVAKDTEFSLSVLYEVLHGRYMNRVGGLIVTSNMTLDEVAQKMGDDRLVSRLAEMCRGKIFKIAGSDRRAIRA
jgi:DNA replication protein DnaC